jgi:hypothetical protein
LDDLANFHETFEFNADTDLQVPKEEEEEDFLKVISENEISFKVHAESKFQDLRKKNSQFPAPNDSISLQKVVSDPECLPGDVNKILGPNEKRTCIFV